MTINVVVATYHGVVLGCDSLSSIVERAFFPFRHNAVVERDAQGNVIRDADGNLVIPYHEDQLVNTATNVVSGVQKMFLLHESPDTNNVEASVAAMTSGLATLNGIVIAEVAQRFKKRCVQRDGGYRTTELVVNDFLDFVRPLWEVQVDYANTPEESRPGLSDLNFLLAG